MDLFMKINSAINSFVWGPIMLVLMVGTGMYLSYRAGFIQFRYLKYVLNKTIGGALRGEQSSKDGDNISPFQAMTTALASTIGTGNIVGVATAIGVGGPGAVFWMWFSALFGMMTKYSEIVLSLKFREKDDMGMYKGGPMYYLKNGVGKKFPKLGIAMGTFFSFFAAIACLGTGNMTQGNAIASSMQDTFGISPYVTAVVLTICVAAVIIGGIKSISKFTEKVVPAMALFYIVFAIIIIVMNFREIPHALYAIFMGAFNPKAVFGGAAGVTIMKVIQMGIARGVFSNEAGLGSAPIAHAASSTKDPVEQGIWGIFEVFIVTFIICSMTALVILTSVDPATGEYIWAAGQYSGAVLTLKAFEFGLPGKIGSIGLSIALTMFAMSTTLGWCYYGETSWGFLLRNHDKARHIAIWVYRALYVVCVFLGCVASLDLVWGISDTFNGLMAIPNLCGILLLSGVVFKETKRYFGKVEEDKRAAKGKAPKAVEEAEA